MLFPFKRKQLCGCRRCWIEGVQPTAAYNVDDLPSSPSVCENQSRSGNWSNLLIFITWSKIFFLACRLSSNLNYRCEMIIYCSPVTSAPKLYNREIVFTAACYHLLHPAYNTFYHLCELSSIESQHYESWIEKPEMFLKFSTTSVMWHPPKSNIINILVWLNLDTDTFRIL